MTRPPKPRTQLKVDPALSQSAVEKRRAALNTIPFVNELLDLEPPERKEAAEAIRHLILVLPHMQAAHNNPLSAAEVAKELTALGQRMIDAITRLQGLDVALRLEAMLALIEQDRLTYRASRGRLPPNAGLRHLAAKLEQLFKDKYFTHLETGERRQLIFKILIRASEKVIIKGLPDEALAGADLDRLFVRPMLP